MLEQPDFSRDRRGWFYRALAPDPACAVLEVGEAFARNWFPNVLRRDLADMAAEPLASRFDMVLLHNTLGGCATLQTAIQRAHGLLRRGGLLIVAGENRLCLASNVESMTAQRPRASGWGFRGLLSRAGFEGIVLYTVFPDAIAPVHVIQVHRLSARKFFYNVLRTRNSGRWSFKRLAVAAFTEMNLMPYLQPEFIVVGSKC
jgi:SAM-dependent methyltransferase